MAFQLRQATLEDAEFIYQLKKQTLMKYVEAIWGWDESEQRERFFASFRPQDHQVIVVDTQAVGDLVVSHGPSEINIDGIYVLPEFQGRGIGSSVMGQIIQEGRRNQSAINLQVFKKNPALALYRRLGFEITSETETHYLMCKNR